MLIEDDAVFMQVAKATFRQKGHTVFTATDVSEAEELWAMARETIDLVVSDNILGYDRGEELVQRFQKQEPNVQFVLCSGEPLDHEIPGIPFLLKPFNVSTLFEKIS